MTTSADLVFPPRLVFPGASRFGRVLAAVAIALLTSGGPALALSVTVPYVNADDVHAMGLTGAGQPIGMLDLDGADRTHPNLPNVVQVLNYSAGPLTIDYHPTMVAGVLGGTLPGNGGVAPGAKVTSIDLYSTGMGLGDSVSATMKAVHELGGSTGIWNMSCGFVGPAGTGQDKLSLFLDYATNEYDLVFVKSAGNEGSITLPGAAYNVITVGGTGQGMDPLVDYSRVSKIPQSGYESGQGELADGRSKPDIVAPGQQVTSTTHPWPPVDRTGNGTSYAAPHVAGTAALLRQYADVQGKEDDHRVIKAVMLNATDKDGGEKTQEKYAGDKLGVRWLTPVPGQDPLDVQMGAGQLNCIAAVTQYSPAEALAGIQYSGRIDVDPLTWDFNAIDPLATVDYQIRYLLEGGTKLTATLAWDRLITWEDIGPVDGVPDYGDGFILEQLANLNMVLIDRLGNEIRLLDSLRRASYSESLVDTVEHIYFTIPFTDYYGIRVRNLSDHPDPVIYGWALWSHPVPEPVTLAGLVLGVGCLGRYLRRRR